MQSSDYICMGCMHRKDPEEKICPYCGYSEDAVQAEPFLPVRTTLHEIYTVGRVLHANGEGATYIGWDNAANSPVLIREYLPDGLVKRPAGGELYVPKEYAYTFNEGLVQFLELARGLVRMRELPALVSVYDIFEEGGTAYYVSENIDGITYREFLLRNGGTLRWDQIGPLLMPVLSTLASLHAVGIIHRGISPETLMVGRDGKIRLIGFCIEPVRTARTDFTAQLFPGYAAIEQYGFDDRQGKWTDVYSFAALVYRTLVGNPPPEATSRVTDDNMTVPATVVESTPANVISALADALQILPEDRIQTAESFKDELSLARGTSPLGSTARFSKKSVTGGTSGDRRGKKKGTVKYWLMGLVITIVLIAILAAVFIPMLMPHEEDPTGSSAISAPAPVVTSNGQASVPDNSTVVTPSLVGQFYSAVVNNVDYKDKFKFVLSESKEYSDQYEKGVIISQSPTGGETVQNGTTITLVISLGSLKAEIPDVIGMGREEAQIALYKAGFSQITVLDINDAAQEPASVVKVEALEQTVPYTVGDEIYVDLPISITYNNYEPPQSSVPAHSSSSSTPSSNSSSSRSD